MRVSVKTAMVLLIALGFLLPGVVALGNEVEDEQSPDETVEISLPYLGRAPKISINDPQPLRIAKAERDISKNKVSFFPGVAPFLSDMEPLTRSVRSRDVWMKDVEIADGDNPGTPGSFGNKGEKTTFTVKVQNNGTAGDVIVRFKAVQYPLEEGDQVDDMPIEHKEEKTVSDLGTSQEDTVTFDWVPSAASLFVLNFTAFEPDDADDTNNHLYWYGWVNAVGDPCDTMHQAGFSPQSGNMHVDDAYNDPEPEHHSATPVIAHWNDATHTYAPGNNSMNTPWFDLNDFNRKYAVWYSNLFSGSLGASDHHKMLLRYDNQADGWIVSADVDATANAQVSTDWFHFISGENTPGIQINYRDVTTNIMYRLCVGVGGGAVKGYMFDDLEVFGVQNFTAVDDFAQIQRTSMSLVKDASLSADDDNGNGAIELLGEQGDELTFKYKITNTGSARISQVTFDIVDNPESLDVEFNPTTLNSALDKNDFATFEITLTIPEDARASVDFREDENDDDYKYNPYWVKFSATATGIDPNGGTTPDPETVTADASVEALVEAAPAYELSATVDNLTGAQGDTHKYSITIENKGNCNLTSDIDGQVELTVEEKPPGPWSVSILDDKIELEYEEDTDIEVTVTSPANEKAGYYEVVIEAAMDAIDEDPQSVTLYTGVEQVFGLDMDFKDRNDAEKEVDPTQPNQLRHPITFEVTNSGNGKDTAKFTVTAENADDKDWFDMEEDTVDLDPVGGVHDEEEFTIEFNVPEDAVHGEHKFTVKANSEKDEDTETDEKEITFTILRPDLTMSTAIKKEPGMPVKGEESEIRLRIFNNVTEGGIGTSATSFSVYLYIDDEFVDWQSVNILQKGQLMDLPAFSYVFEEDREYEIRAIVDPSDSPLGHGNVTEADETNNEATWTVTVVAPDLEWDKKADVSVMVGTDFPMQNDETGDYDLALKWVEDGTIVTVTFEIKNEGEADASNIQVNLKVMWEDKNGMTGKWHEANETVSSLKMGKGTDVVFDWTPDSTKWETRYWFVLEIDPEEKVPESDDNNNRWEPASGFMSPKKPSDGSPGFEMVFLLGALLLVGAVLYWRRR